MSVRLSNCSIMSMIEPFWLNLINFSSRSCEELNVQRNKSDYSIWLVRQHHFRTLSTIGRQFKCLTEPPPKSRDKVFHILKEVTDLMFVLDDSVF